MSILRQASVSTLFAACLLAGGVAMAAPATPAAKASAPAKAAAVAVKPAPAVTVSKLAAKPASASTAVKPAPMKPVTAATPAKPAVPATPAKPGVASAKPAVPAKAASGVGLGGTQVWVNTAAKVYHCPGTKYFGKTKKGQYMSEAAARGAGNRADRGAACATR
ncbi:signal peptide protein [Brachymonas denitrificans]|uniref:signal peptide protein n=1 Tax=Brachymonas denitrificans TaxID=28220 RepID=UPI002AFF5981|nr:signal peptide protein [Brachymonas denitrificans]